MSKSKSKMNQRFSPEMSKSARCLLVSLSLPVFCNNRALAGKPFAPKAAMDTVAVTRAVQLKGMPIYNGPGLAYFQRGYIQGGNMLCETFFSQAQPGVIYQYYLQQLPSNGWKIKSTNNQMIMGQNSDGATCTIRVHPISGQYKSSFSLFRNPIQ